MGDLENKIKNLHMEYKENLEKGITENDKLKADINQIHDENESLGNLIKNVQENVNNLDNSLSDKVESIKGQVDDLDDSVTSLSPNINKNSERIVRLDSILEKLEPITENLLKDIIALKESDKTHSDTLETLQNKYDELREALNMKVKELDKLREQGEEKIMAKVNSANDRHNS